MSPIVIDRGRSYLMSTLSRTHVHSTQLISLLVELNPSVDRKLCMISILISQYQKMGVVLVFWERHSAWISLAVFHNGFHGFHDAGILLVPNHGDAEFRTKRRELAEAISAVHFGRLTNVISNAVFAPQHVPQLLGFVAVGQALLAQVPHLGWNL